MQHLVGTPSPVLLAPTLDVLEETLEIKNFKICRNLLDKSARLPDLLCVRRDVVQVEAHLRARGFYHHHRCRSKVEKCLEVSFSHSHSSGKISTYLFLSPLFAVALQEPCLGDNSFQLFYRKHSYFAWIAFLILQ